MRSCLRLYLSLRLRRTTDQRARAPAPTFERRIEGDCDVRRKNRGRKLETFDPKIEGESYVRTQDRGREMVGWA